MDDDTQAAIATTSAVEALPAEARKLVEATPVTQLDNGQVLQDRAIVPREPRGKPVLPEGADGVFTESWFPLCLSTDVLAGQVKGYDFLDGRVIVWRGEDGLAHVTSAFCPHMGASLEAGDVVDNTVRCGFHHWQYDGNGRCARTAIGDEPPVNAGLFVFPSQEKWGLIWAFNGLEPRYAIPDFPHPTEQLLVKTIELPDLMPVDPWVQCANTPDIQHIQTLHRIQFSEDPMDLVNWTDFSMRYQFDGFFDSGTSGQWDVGIFGTSLYYQSAHLDGRWFGFMVPMGLPRPGRTKNFFVLAVQPSEDRAADEKFLDLCALTEMGIVGEDTHIMTTMRFRPGMMTKSDRVLSRFFTYMRKYPRSHLSAPFIK